ncbi:MAG: hypothetical protein NTW56_02275 [Alphaproteobacteria bacterium]|nr:hypothetical protein [Alphaproteobacteria bacterium]
MLNAPDDEIPMAYKMRAMKALLGMEAKAAASRMRAAALHRQML